MQVTSWSCIHERMRKCVNPRVGFVTHWIYVSGPSLLPAGPRDRYPMGAQIALKTEPPLAEGSVMM